MSINPICTRLMLLRMPSSARAQAWVIQTVQSLRSCSWAQQVRRLIIQLSSSCQQMTGMSADCLP